jgi:hypothetical protein
LGEIRDCRLFALNVVNLVDCLDRARAQLITSPTEPGRIVNVMRFAFDHSELTDDPVIFKVPEALGDVFVSQSFRDAVAKHDLTGAVFLDPTESLFSGLIPGPLKSR